MDIDINDWETRVELLHAEQIEKFGWCVCEGTDGQGQMAEDCPTNER